MGPLPRRIQSFCWYVILYNLCRRKRRPNLVAGNLSSDKVTKRDIFDLFHHYGRLAQISLKSAFGFVQYHTLEEAQAAVENLQGAEVKGRKIRG